MAELRLLTLTVWRRNVFLVLNVLNVILFKHSELTGLYTGKMEMLMQA